jgi:hypothetical protein
MDIAKIAKALEEATAPTLVKILAVRKIVWIKDAREELDRARKEYHRVVAEVLAGRPGNIAEARQMVIWAERDLTELDR